MPHTQLGAHHGVFARRLIGRAAVAIAALLLGATWQTAAAADGIPTRRPNIILIVADDLGYGDLGCYGQKAIQTPNLDRLAAEGMRFTQFYAGSTVCAPSRCVLMTGLHTGHCHIRGNGGVALEDEHVTVAELLKQQGYATGLVGKWGLGNEGTSGVPTRQGFDFFFGYLHQGHAHNYYPAYLIRNESRVKLNNVVPNEGRFGQGISSNKAQYSPDVMFPEIGRFIDEHRDEPFFLYLAYTLPHANNEAGQAGMETPDYGIYANEPWPEPIKGHAAMVSRLDFEVGEIVRQLKKLGIDRDTLVLFTSDNGPHREGGYNPDFYDSNGPLRGIKRDMYEGGIRVPLIAWWPGHIRPGRTSDQIGYFADILPTFAELAGAKTPKLCDGISLLPTLLGRPEQQRQHEFLYWEFYENGGAQAVRAGDWKAIRQPAFNGPIELYNLADDLGEQRNVAAQHPQIVAEMARRMDHSHVPSDLWKVRGRRRAQPATNP